MPVSPTCLPNSSLPRSWGAGRGELARGFTGVLEQARRGRDGGAGGGRRQVHQQLELELELT